MKLFRKLLMALASLFFISTAHAGIPVFDGVAVAGIIEQYAELEQQFATMQSQLSTANSQLNAMTGARGMAGLLTNPDVYSQLPQQWSSVLSSIKGSPTYASERAALPTSTIPSINAIYDQQAASRATMTDFFAKANLRLQQIQQLQQSIDSASDNAAKEDLHNRLVSEQNSITATTQLLALLRQKLDDANLAARQTAHQTLICTEFKNCPQ